MAGEDPKKNGKLWQAALLALLSGGGGSALFLTLYDTRPDPHTGTDDAEAMSRAEVRMNKEIGELRDRIIVLEASQQRHIESDMHKR